MLKRKVVLFLSVVLLVFGVYFPSAEAADDITGIALEKELRSVISLGIMQGYSDGVYKPNEIVNRASFAAFIARALNLPEGTGSFPDVSPTSSLAKDIYRASSAKLINGYHDGRFGPNEPITREQMLVVIQNALDSMGIEKGQAAIKFTDAEQITPSIPDETISNIVSYGIILGFPNGDGTFRFDPRRQATRAEAAAFISRLLNVINEKQDETAFRLATVGADGQLDYQNNAYSSYEAAEKGITNAKTQYITQGQKVLKMSQGMVYSKPAPTSGAITRIYATNLSTVITYVPANMELTYISSTKDAAKVQIADTIGYVKHEDSWLVPNSLVNGKSYYSASKGDLTHYIYNPVTQKYSSYVYGKAPSFLANGKKYYSLNGETFLNDSGIEIGKAYQYFNMLSVRSKTSYTAEELNSYIAKVKPDSPLKNLGQKFKEAEAKYNINALYLFATAIHESNYGLSDKAKDCKNMFGIGVYDSDPSSCKPFTSLEESIDYAANYMSNHYVKPTGGYYNGAIPGDKSKGVNVRYASDPYWGQKVAGHMNRIDSTLGKKDFAKYTLAVNTSDTLNVRREANVNLAAIYSYRGQGFPLLLLEEVTGQYVDGSDKWWKITSDIGDPDALTGYVHGHYVSKLTIAGNE